MSKQQDTLDRTIAFLQKREGIDKTLKIVRYASRLIAAVSPPGSGQKRRFEALQSSIGTSRKAYRLGKFLQDVNGARKMKNLSSSLALLELMGYAGEGTYYFVDQFLWLMKAGFLPKQHESAMAKVSAWAEVVGYAANILLSINKHQQLLQQEQALARKLKHKLKQDSEDGRTLDASLWAQLSETRSARMLRLALIVQDMADSMTAINDITDGRHRGINHPVLLSCAGLISAAVSTYKYWGT